MATTKTATIKYASLQTDLLASGLLGLIAGTFASITLASLGVLGKQFFGVTISAAIVIPFFVAVCVAGIIVGRWLSKYVGILYSFVKFGEAGGQNWLVDMGIVNLLILLTGVSGGIYFAVYKGISFLVASTNSYFWSKLWVFYGAQKQDETKRVSKFAVATSLGLVLNVTLASIINFVGPNVVTSISATGWANIATICGSLFAMLFNFVLYKLWVFKA